MTRHVLLFALLLAALLPSDAHAQLPDDPTVAGAFLAWERGDYPAALRGYLEALGAPDGSDHVARIAALTGESFETTELAEDGSGIVVGPRGRYAAWSVAGPDGRPEGRVVELATGYVVATVPGTPASFSGSGVLAWYRVEETAELAQAARAMDAARAAGDRAAFFEAYRRARWLEASGRELRLLDVDTGEERVVDAEGWLLGEAVYAPGADALFVVAGRPDRPERNEILTVSPEGRVVVIDVPGEAGDGFKAGLLPVPDRPALVWEAPATRPVPTAPGTAAVRSDRVGVGFVDLESGATAFVAGATDPALSADGSRLAWLDADGGLNRVFAAPATAAGLAAATDPVVATEMEVANPALSPDGSVVAYQKRPVHDWEVFVVPSANAAPGEGERQVTWEIQHDLYPVFLDATTVMAMKGEGRHRRAFLYDLERPASDGGIRLHHNNTVRTIAPEYEWAPLPDGRGVVLVSERDGDTVSPERGVYLVRLDRPVTADALRDRLEEALAAETALQAKGERLFRPLADRVRPVTEAVDVGRIYENARVLYTYGSKYITQPGNRMASDYLAERLRSDGYDVELQWFEPGGLRTANVIARLPGTVDPDVVYVASSHYDSTERGPGADDDTSGTTALLEVARVLKDHPQPATVELAFFTGEEAGLLGSREYVRRAVASGKRIVGALNNDMVGWADGPRLDNTIRYSNPGIRDVQHGAALLFSDLILYDALYYKNTDAHAYYEEYGDIVGGIGSYPVLGNPHYHQFTDRLNTVDHRLVAEVARTTAATLMLLASSPSRVTGLELRPVTGGVEARWEPLPESTVEGYEVTWTDADGQQRSARTAATSHAIRGIAPGSDVTVRGFNRDGMPSWDRARVTVER